MYTDAGHSFSLVATSAELRGNLALWAPSSAATRHAASYAVSFGLKQIYVSGTDSTWLTGWDVCVGDSKSEHRQRTVDHTIVRSCDVLRGNTGDWESETELTENSYIFSGHTFFRLSGRLTFRLTHFAPIVCHVPFPHAPGCDLATIVRRLLNFCASCGPSPTSVPFLVRCLELSMIRAGSKVLRRQFTPRPDLPPRIHYLHYSFNLRFLALAARLLALDPIAASFCLHSVINNLARLFAVLASTNPECNPSSCTHRVPSRL